MLGYAANVRRRRADHPRLEYVRAEPVPGEADPALRHERPRRGAPAALRRRRRRPATGSSSRITAPGSSSRLRHGRAGEATTSAAAKRREPRDHRPRARAHRRRRVADPPCRGPRRARPPLLARHDEAREELGWAPQTPFADGFPRPPPGTRPTAAGGSRSSRRVSTRTITRSSTRPVLRAPAPSRPCHRRRTCGGPRGAAG